MRYDSIAPKIQRILELFQRARGSAHVTSVWYGDYEFYSFAEAALIDRVAFEIQKAGITPSLVVKSAALYRAKYDHPGKGWNLRWDGGKNHGLWDTFNCNGERISDPPYLTTYEIIQKRLVSLDEAVQQLLEAAETNIYTRRVEASRLLKDTEVLKAGRWVPRMNEPSHRNTDLRVPTRSELTSA